jgi:2-keto-4-pentenoate hydratase/2-oxohepta-3-ene-1,7-dioic acid hydratase in catechol pathway
VRVGRVTNGDQELTAVHAGGQWHAVRARAGGVPSSALDVLLRPSEVEIEDSEPLPDDFRPMVPYRPNRNVICLGKNFRAHAEEFAAYRAEAEAVPEHPIVFTKTPESLCGAEDDIVVWRPATAALDYEAELGVIIGRAGAAIDPGDAASHVAGYTVVNDVTARDLQERHKQWFLGKSLPRASPVGPVLVTPDELEPLDRRNIACSVNGESRQSAVLGDMLFRVPEAISIISGLVPLLPGDIISMGTPQGVGIGFKPPRFLEDGDEILCTIEGIGELRNVVHLVDEIPNP